MHNIRYAIFLSILIYSGWAQAEAGYDPGRDGKQELISALARATQEAKPVLVIVGGDWCPSCVALDRAMLADAAMQRLLTERLILTKINYSAKNKNEAAMKMLPFFLGYPNAFLLDANGKIIKTKSIFDFEANGKFDLAGYRLALLRVLDRQQ